MAEPRKQGDPTPAPVVRSATDAVEAAPEPSKSAQKKVAVVWPSNKFVVEGLPVVDNKGVPVTAEQYKTLETAAKKCGVTLREVND